MIRRLLPVFAISALVSAGPVLADTALKDTSWIVDITGNVTPAQFSCLVTPSESSVSILELPDNLIKQGDNATTPVTVHLKVDGGDKCTSLVDDGKIAFRFSGVADDADGTALANSLTDETAAKGVAIGIFDGENKPLKVNNSLLPAKMDTTFGLQMVKLTNQQPVSGNINSFVTIDIERL